MAISRAPTLTRTRLRTEKTTIRTTTTPASKKTWGLAFMLILLSLRTIRLAQYPAMDRRPFKRLSRSARGRGRQFVANPREFLLQWEGGARAPGLSAHHPILALDKLMQLGRRELWQLPFSPQTQGRFDASHIC